MIAGSASSIDLSLSPDGGTLAFTGRKIGDDGDGPEKNQLYVRRLDQLQAVALPGTVSTLSAMSPSLGGRQVAYPRWQR